MTSSVETARKKLFADVVAEVSEIKNMKKVEHKMHSGNENKE